MKRLQLLSLLILICTSLGLVSCDTEPVDSLLVGQQPDATSAFQVDFGGSTYNATTTGAIIQDGTIQILGSKTNAGYFVITVPGVTRGNYTNAVIKYYPTAGATDFYSNSSSTVVNGTVSIASINTTTHKLTGTFNFKGYWGVAGANMPAIDFTNGVFTNIAYTGNTPTEPVGNPLFKVNFNGATWTAATTRAVYASEYLSVMGIKPDGTSFMITVPYPRVGTFEFAAQQPDPNSPAGLLAMAYVPGNAQSSYIADAGGWGQYSEYPEYIDTAIVNITAIDIVNKTVSGTFGFTGVRSVFDMDNPTTDEIETITFTSGEFSNVSFAEGEAPVTNNIFTAKLDGQNFVGTTISATSFGGNINLGARRGAVESIALFFPSTITQGTYTLSALNTYVAMYMANETPSGMFGASGGTLIISEHDTVNRKIKGTFNFTGGYMTTETHEISDGHFDVTY